MASYVMPMSRLETEQYVKFRLMVAGTTEELFDQECYELIHSQSGGICREVSRLADNGLLEAYLRGESRVTRGIIEYCTRIII